MPCRFDRGEQAARRGVTHARASGDERPAAEAVRTMCFALSSGPRTPAAGTCTLDEMVRRYRRSRSTRFAPAPAHGPIHGRLLRRRATSPGRSRPGVARSRLMVAINHEVVAAVELAAGNVAAERATRIKYDILKRPDDGFELRRRRSWPCVSARSAASTRRKGIQPDLRRSRCRGRHAVAVDRSAGAEPRACLSWRVRGGRAARREAVQMLSTMPRAPQAQAPQDALLLASCGWPESTPRRSKYSVRRSVDERRKTGPRSPQRVRSVRM